MIRYTSIPQSVIRGSFTTNSGSKVHFNVRLLQKDDKIKMFLMLSRFPQPYIIIIAEFLTKVKFLVFNFFSNFLFKVIESKLLHFMNSIISMTLLKIFFCHKIAQVSTFFFILLSNMNCFFN